MIPISAEPQPATNESLMTVLPTQPKEALAELFRRYSRLVFSIGLCVLHDAGEAEEIVQEVFLYLHQKSNQFDETGERLGRGSYRLPIIGRLTGDTFFIAGTSTLVQI